MSPNPKALAIGAAVVAGVFILAVAAIFGVWALALYLAGAF